MKSKGNIVFLGMMGSGKTSIGKLFSQKHKLKFYDTDRLIENAMGMKISKIFENNGEKYFREIEETTTLKFLKKNNTVISLGGGAFLNNKIKKEVLDNHISFWLNWDIETLVNRIKDSAKRPIVYKSSKIEIVELIKKRSIIYSKAMYKIDCENLSKNQIVKKIIKIYDNN